MKETVLLFHFDDQKIMKIRRALMPLNIRVKTVSPGEYHQAVGYLAGNKEIRPETAAEESSREFEEEMMIMAWLNSQQVDQVLRAFRKQGIPRISYKAIVTPLNQYWDCRALYEELKKEHAAVTGRNA